MSALLVVRGLTVAAAGHRPILAEVDLEVGVGEIVGLIGESGAGKSTLGLAALGYLHPGCARTAGTIHFRDADVMAMAPAALRRFRATQVAYVAQSAAAAFNPALQLADQIAEVPRLLGRIDASQGRALARTLLERLELPDPGALGRRYPHQVSGGQLQRAMIAMALAAEPALVVLDEPTTALDVTTQLGVLRAIRAAIAERGVAALYISHDLAVVAQLADRIVVLRDGRVVEDGPTGRVVASPRTPYTTALIALRRASEPPAAPTAAAPVLAVQGVTVGYRGGPAVVDAASLTLVQGEALALVGQSGSGKSTLARAIMGLLPLRGGSVRLGGVALPELAERSRAQRRALQLVHQSPDVALNPRQSVREIVGRPLRFFLGLDRLSIGARVEALLAAVELPLAVIDRLPGSLSGGQKQRVCIARALAAEPAVLVCDEITSALDLLVEDAIIALLRRIQAERGLTILFITHNLWLARRFAQDVAVMNAGRIVEAGPTGAVFAAPRDAYTRALLAAVPTLDAGWLDRRLA